MFLTLNLCEQQGFLDCIQVKPVLTAKVKYLYILLDPIKVKLNLGVNRWQSFQTTLESPADNSHNFHMTFWADYNKGPTWIPLKQK